MGSKCDVPTRDQRPADPLRCGTGPLARYRYLLALVLRSARRRLREPREAS